jgi:lauroyl/myristoyl acyltransferase
MTDPRHPSVVGTEGKISMKSRLRNWIKRCYYKAEPFLSGVWFALKYVEIFLLYPCILSLPPHLAWKTFRMRDPWLFLRPSQKRVILDNLAQGVRAGTPSDRIALLARRHALFCSSIRFETQFLLTSSAKKVDNTVRFEGLSLVDAAQAEGKGVMLLGCHAGSFYRAIFASARRGYKLHVITMRPEDAGQGIWKDRVGSILYAKLLKKLEEEPNVRIQYVGGSLLDIPRALRRGEIVCATLDVPVAQGEQKTSPIEFLGRQCYFSSHLIRLAARLDAVCLPYVTHGEKDLCWIKIHPPLMTTENRGDEGSDVEKEMRYVFRVLEHHILTYPEQWWLWNVLGGFGSPTYSAS